MPAEHVRRLEVQQLLDAQDCPWRYRRTWLDKVANDPIPPDTFLASMIWQVVKQANRDRQATGLQLMPEDLHQMALEAVQDCRKVPDPQMVDLVARGAWVWYQHHGKDAHVMMMEAPYQLELDGDRESELGKGGWAITGKVPMVFRTQAAPYAQVAILVLGKWDATRLQTDPAVVYAWLGATQGLRLKVSGVHVLQVVLGPEPGCDAFHVAAPKVTELQAKVALLQAQAARQNIVDNLYSHGWAPNRRASTCSFSQCRTAGACESSMGGLVAP